MQEYIATATFDWYAATVNIEPLELIATLSDRLSAEPRRARGLHGYSAGADFLRGTDVIAKMIYGGEQAPHVWASGNDAQELARVLRTVYPAEHYLTLVDVALDFVDGNPWEHLYRACRRVADYLPTGAERARPLKLASVGDWLREAEGFPGGRTLYVGSMKSPVFARLYEKGKQMRALYPDQLDKYDPGWCRLEVQIRPQGEARRELAQMEPEAMWSASRWSADLYAEVVGTGAVPFGMKHGRQRDDERAYRFLLKQYGGLLRRRADEFGAADPVTRIAAWEALGRALAAELS